jgi:endogenous inhibitor of DNA gyrase (YacG/DUF329 family)
MNFFSKTTTIKVACPHCGQRIEYSPDSEGSDVPCPACEEPVLLQMPAKTQLARLANDAAKTREQSAGRGWTGLAGCACFVVGGALVLKGCDVDAQSALGQIYGAMQYCAGWLMIGLGCVTLAVSAARRR